MISVTQQCRLNVLALLYALYALQQIIIDAITDHRIFSVKCKEESLVYTHNLVTLGGAHLLVVGMLQHLFAYPGGCGDQFTSCTLLNEMQILLNGAVCVCVHLHGLQIASYKWHQTRKYVGLRG